MKMISIVVKPFLAESVIRILEEAGLDSWFVREAKGYGRQKGYLDRYLGGEYSMAFLPKVEILALIPAEGFDTLAEKIVKAARTGRIGDGKVFVMTVPGLLATGF
ncbi:MAG: P-II family nitrogen regulator [Gemmataceae bacterium]|nr:P-II family nitrogen regulator [Planctomycetota bacterium]